LDSALSRVAASALADHDAVRSDRASLGHVLEAYEPATSIKLLDDERETLRHRSLR